MKKLLKVLLMMILISAFISFLPALAGTSIILLVMAFHYCRWIAGMYILLTILCRIVFKTSLWELINSDD